MPPPPPAQAKPPAEGKPSFSATSPAPLTQPDTRTAGTTPPTVQLDAGTRLILKSGETVAKDIGMTPINEAAKSVVKRVLGITLKDSPLVGIVAEAGHDLNQVAKKIASTEVVQYKLEAVAAISQRAQLALNQTRTANTPEARAIAERKYQTAKSELNRAIADAEIAIDADRKVRVYPADTFAGIVYDMMYGNKEYDGAGPSVR